MDYIDELDKIDDLKGKIKSLEDRNSAVIEQLMKNHNVTAEDMRELQEKLNLDDDTFYLQLHTGEIPVEQVTDIAERRQSKVIEDKDGSYLHDNYEAVAKLAKEKNVGLAEAGEKVLSGEWALDVKGRPGASTEPFKTAPPVSEHKSKFGTPEGKLQGIAQMLLGQAKNIYGTYSSEHIARLKKAAQILSPGVTPLFQNTEAAHQWLDDMLAVTEDEEERENLRVLKEALQ
jgi:hypothetical protein